MYIVSIALSNEQTNLFHCTRTTVAQWETENWKTVWAVLLFIQYIRIFFFSSTFIEIFLRIRSISMLSMYWYRILCDKWIGWCIEHVFIVGSLQRILWFSVIWCLQLNIKIGNYRRFAQFVICGLGHRVRLTQLFK